MTQQPTPLISVVMPSYNHAAFIGRAVASVLAQTYGNLELIVVDNNSSDGTDEALAEIKDPRLKIVKFSNGGIIASSRNLGIKRAAGEYVAFIDSDDIWLPGKLETQIRAFGREPEAGLAYCRFRTITGGVESPEVFPRPGRCYDGDVFGPLYLHTFIACSGVMVKRAALDSAGGFSEAREMVAIEDMDLWLRIAAQHKVLLSSEEPLFLYQVHPGGMSSGWGRKYMRTFRLAARHARRAGPANFLMAAAWGLVSTIRGAVRA